MFWPTLLLLAGAQSALAIECKCTPSDPCWPSLSTWNALNTSVNGKLIQNQPRAQSCYPGDTYDLETCQHVAEDWGNSTVISLNPIGYSYPLEGSACPPINTTIPSYPLCNLGSAPVYTINATEAVDVAAGIKFAKENNVRLVIKNTGHDMVGRSQGYGSLSIWIRNIRTGLEFQERYVSDGCASNWTGSAVVVGGGYTWEDGYNFAAAHGHIVVGGDERTVGSIGGYIQGGGHSPTSHYFGLATDQVLEYTVVLASGEVVKANACNNTDLFTALRGGGGGTFGVVVSATIKAHPTHPMYEHSLAIIPLNTATESISLLLNTTAKVMSKFSILSDEGLSGYALVGDGTLDSDELPTAFYGHGFGILMPDNNTSANNVSISQLKSLVDKEIVQDLLPYNDTDLYISSSWSYYPSFASYYNAGGGQATVGNTNIMLSSRMFGKTSLLNNTAKLSNMLHTVFTDGSDNATLSTNSTVFLMNLIGGGKVLEPQPYTSVNPAWRKTYALNEIIVEWPENLNAQKVQESKDDVVYRKTDAMRELTPGMGAYVNEAVGEDPRWKSDFWGPDSNYEWLKSVKEKYDPDEVFWCWRCVGSEGWTQQTDGKENGPLCRMESN